MKRFAQLALVLLAAAALLCACGTGGTPTQTPAPTPVQAAAKSPPPSEPPTPLTRYAGTYVGYSVYALEKYVRWDQVETYSVTLDSDGTGSLNWGEGNSGPIHEWGTNGDKLLIKAGVSVMDARCEGGVLYIDLGDGMEICFIKPGTDTAAMPIVDADTLKAQPAASFAGVYYPYAMESGDYCVRSPDFGSEADGMITIRDDGTFVMLTGDIENVFTWSVEGDGLLLVDTLGNRSTDVMTVTVPAGGIFTMEYMGQNMKTYYATADADTSSIPAISLEEYQALVG